MFEPGRLDFKLWANAEFPNSDDDWIGIRQNGTLMSMTGKTLVMQVRLYEGQPGDPLISINAASASGNRIVFSDSSKTYFKFVIDKAKMATLPVAASDNAPKLPVYQLPWDLMIDNEVYLYGFWDVRTGVTR